MYSTCSIHSVENEEVVLQALASNEAKAGNFRLARREDVLPTWPRRGLPEKMGNGGSYHYYRVCVRLCVCTQPRIYILPSCDTLLISALQTRRNHLFAVCLGRTTLTASSYRASRSTSHLVLINVNNQRQTMYHQDRQNVPSTAVTMSVNLIREVPQDYRCKVLSERRKRKQNTDTR